VPQALASPSVRGGVNGAEDSSAEWPLSIEPAFYETPAFYVTSALIVAINDPVSSIPSRLSGEKPDSVNVTA